MSEIKTYSQKESKEMIENNVNDFKYVYDFQIEGEQIVPPKIKFDIRTLIRSIIMCMN